MCKTISSELLLLIKTAPLSKAPGAVFTYLITDPEYPCRVLFFVVTLLMHVLPIVGFSRLLVRLLMGLIPAFHKTPAHLKWLYARA